MVFVDDHLKLNPLLGPFDEHFAATLPGDPWRVQCRHQGWDRCLHLVHIWSEAGLVLWNRTTGLGWNELQWLLMAPMADGFLEGHAPGLLIIQKRTTQMHLDDFCSVRRKTNVLQEMSSSNPGATEKLNVRRNLST